MELFSELLSGLNLLQQKIPGIFTLSTVSYLVPLVTAGVLLSYISITRISYVQNKLRFKVQKNRKSSLSRLTDFLLRYESTKKLLNNLAVKVSMFTSYSYQGNIEIACVFLLGSAAAFVVVFVFILPKLLLTWYVLLVYSVVSVLFALIAFYI